MEQGEGAAETKATEPAVLNVNVGVLGHVDSGKTSLGAWGRVWLYGGAALGRTWGPRRGQLPGRRARPASCSQLPAISPWLHPLRFSATLPFRRLLPGLWGLQ